MKRILANKFWLIGSILCVLFFSACDRASCLDENKDIEGQAWYYKNKLGFDVNIEDTNKTYNVFVNLRVSSNYNYSNFFVMVHQTSPSKLVSKERKEITLINDQGEWLGKGLGDLYDYQVPIFPQTRFKEKGIYHFELEQNMREDTLMNIISAGMRIEDFALAKK
ncbi:MAG: gliding motility lipoprotein GldH [Bacteroidia bacterium]|nr:gliding motility lipoprotein GldH [Bacteroidia bacterium]MCF8427423.1 gliding motility lipoprotein GldH [Bacteroidia bacterium]MCF8447094.1 gliding motility lipoprotein GldH [Bacteroidia bacterium]